MNSGNDFTKHIHVKNIIRLLSRDYEKKSVNKILL